jgi:GNAT superfamily N-acetyltransferase
MLAAWPGYAGEGGALAAAATKPAIAVRPFAVGDEAAVLELLGVTLGGGPLGRRPPEFFHWKHRENPFGSSFMLVAESEGRLVGLRAFMRWRFEGGGRSLAAVRAVDTATHPNFQGMGVFSRLTLAALEALTGQVDLVFNTPNGASRPGYLKLGWREVGRLPVAVRVRRPLRLARGLRAPSGRLPAGPAVAAEPADRVLARTEPVEGLLAAARSDDGRLRTPRDLGYLRWRYGSGPLLGYRAVTEEVGGALQGLAIFRVRPRGGAWESTVAEVLVPAGDRGTARRLLRHGARAAAVDHLTLHAPSGTAIAGAAAGAGFLPTPRGMAFVVKPLRDGIRPDPTGLRSWALSLGDLEVF